jgi:hypothetical protein
VFQEFGALFLPEVAQPRCLRPTQYPLLTGDRLNTNPAIASPTQGIHQAPLKNFGVCSSFASTTDSNYAITSPVSSIPQAAIESFGVCVEPAQLRQWIVSERCRIVGLLGIGGIGKSTIGVKAAFQMQAEF